MADMIETSDQARLAALLDLEGLTPQERAKRITIWNRVENRKVSGNAAPLRKNLRAYLKRNPQCDAYMGQDQKRSLLHEKDKTTKSVVSINGGRVPIWNRCTQTRISGNAAPLRKNIAAFLMRNPGCEVYNGQDQGRTKRGDPFKSPIVDGEPGKTIPPCHEEPRSTVTSSESAYVRDTVFMFHRTHQVVPTRTAFCPYAISADEVKPACPAKLSKTPKKQQGCGCCDCATNRDIAYEDMARSWSNLPLWTHPWKNYETEPPMNDSLLSQMAIAADPALQPLTLEDSGNLQSEKNYGHLTAEDILERRKKRDSESSYWDPNFWGKDDSGGLQFSADDYLVDDPSENVGQE